MKIIWIIGLVIVVLYLVYDLLTYRFVNKWTFTHIIGKKGSGKTTLACRLALKYIRKGWHVYTNIDEMHIDGLRHFDINNLGDCVPQYDGKHSILLLCDEVGMIWDNRKYKEFKDSVRDFFKLQRHYKCMCYTFSQSYDIDKKLRDLTDNLALTTKWFRVFSLTRYIARKPVLTESVGDSESRISDNLVYVPFKFKLTFIPKYTTYFDSFSAPSRPPLPYIADFDDVRLSRTKKRFCFRKKSKNG